MRNSWLSGIVGDNFANLLDLLSLDIPNEADATTFLLLWFVFGLLRCTTDRG